MSETVWLIRQRQVMPVWYIDDAQRMTVDMYRAERFSGGDAAWECVFRAGLEPRDVLVYEAHADTLRPVMHREVARAVLYHGGIPITDGNLSWIADRWRDDTFTLAVGYAGADLATASWFCYTAEPWMYQQLELWEDV